MSTILFTNRDLIEETLVKLPTKKIAQVNLFHSSSVSLFDSFWSATSKTYKDEYVLLMLNLVDAIFNQILEDKNFCSESVVKIFSTFNVEFYGNVKSFLNLEGPERVLVAGIICKSGKVPMRDGESAEKCFDLEYQRKIISFLNSVVNVDATDSRYPLLEIFRDYQSFVSVREEKCYLLNKRVLEDEFYNLLEKEYEVIKKRKIEESEKVLAVGQNETNFEVDTNGMAVEKNKMPEDSQDVDNSDAWGFKFADANQEVFGDSAQVKKSD